MDCYQKSLCLRQNNKTRLFPKKIAAIVGSSSPQKKPKNLKPNNMQHMIIDIQLLHYMKR